MTAVVADRDAEGSVALTASAGNVEVYAQQRNSGVWLDYTPEQAIDLGLALIKAAGEASA